MYKNFLSWTQFISLVISGLMFLFLLGAEPNTTESSMYEYEHFLDKGHLGYYMMWVFFFSIGLFIMSTFILHSKKDKTPTKF